jgi:PmbA protein
MDLLAALEQHADQAEVFRIESESTEVSFEAGEIKSSQVKETQGVALRGLIEGRLGFSAAGGQVDAEELVENLVASARFGEPLDLRFPAAAPGPEVNTFDPHLAEVPIARFVEIGREVVARLLEADADAKVDVGLERATARTHLQNNAGADIRQQGTGFHLSASVERVRGDDVLIVYDSYSDIGLSDGYQEMVGRLADKVTRAGRSAPLDSGRMPVIFSPAGAPVLLMPLLMALNGEAVQRGTSPLQERLGDKLFDGRLTLWDDPTLSGRPASASHDDEGVPTRRKALVQGGVVENFLYDLKTAALAGAESTGNGSRSLFSPPSPSTTNLILEPGNTTLSEMLAGIERGLWVESVLGLGQGNPISGAFSNPVGLAYVIEKGEIVGRVKDVAIAGNIYEVLQEIGGLSRESIWVRGRYQLPYILLNELNVVRS